MGVWGRRLLGGLGVLLWHREAFAVAVAVNFQWSCPQAVVPGMTPVLPVSQTIPIVLNRAQLDGSDPTLQLDALQAFLRPADPANSSFDRASPDYYHCLFRSLDLAAPNFIRACRETASTVPEAARADAHENCTKHLHEYQSRLRLLIGEFGQRTAEAGLRATVPPMSYTSNLVGFSVDSARRANAETWLTNFCSPQMHDPSEAAYLASFEFVTQRLPAILQNASVSQSCRDRIAGAYVGLAADSFPRCQSAGAIDPTCAQARTQVRHLLETLRPFLPAEAQARTDGVLSCLLPNATGIPEALRLLEIDYRQANACLRPEMGGAPLVVNEPSLERGTGIYAQYRLQRTGPHSHRIDLNLRFPSLSPADASRYHNQAAGCLSDVNSILAPPGENLEITLNGDTGTPPAPPVDVNIGESSRANSDTWTRTMDCATIVHELMHRLGLVDEYAESVAGHHVDPVSGEISSAGVDGGGGAAPAGSTFLGSMDCRALGPEDSLMNHQFAAYRRSGGRISANSCSCSPEAAEFTACRESLARFASDPRVGCSQRHGARWRNLMNHSRVPAPSAKDLADFNAVTPGLAPDGNSVVVREDVPPAGGLLRPSQFQALIQPGCASANRVFYACSRASYRTSRAHLPDNLLNAGCPRGLPAECRTPGAW